MKRSCNSLRFSFGLFSQEVFFPAITVCNINQVEASFMKQIGIYHNLSQMRALYNEFISGGHEESEDKEHSHHNILGLCQANFNIFFVN